jgi:hypothetical protein
MTLATAEGEKHQRIEIEVEPPSRVRMVSGEAEDAVEQSVGPEGAFIRRGSGAPEPLGAAERGTLERILMTDEALLPLHALQGQVVILGVEAAGPGEVAPSLPAATGIAVRLADPAGSEMRLVVPEAGGFPLRLDYPRRTASGEEAWASDVYSDWRQVEGMSFPYQVFMFVGGQSPAMMRYETIEVELDPATPAEGAP